MKNVRIKVRNSCGGNLWSYVIYAGRRPTRLCTDWSLQKDYTIKAAKAMAKRIGIKYDPEIIKQHGC